jgi:hypothetical protein
MTRALLVAGLLAALVTPRSAAGRAGAASGQAVPRDAYLAELVARSFFRGLLEGQVDTLLPLCAAEVNLDGERLRGAALATRLRELSARARQKGLRLRKLVVLSAEEALRRYGKPPARLRGSVTPGRAVALARFNHAGAAAILARGPGFWRVIALTD